MLFSKNHTCDGQAMEVRMERAMSERGSFSEIDFLNSCFKKNWEFYMIRQGKHLSVEKFRSPKAIKCQPKVLWKNGIGALIKDDT